MKIKYFILIALISIVSLAYGDTLIKYFTAKSDGNSITVSWQANDESAILRYELERGSEEGVFQKVESFDAKGTGYSYSFIDEGAYLKDGDHKLQETTYQYRLKIIKSQNTVSYSNTVNVIHDVSSIRRTWGMIKEMFR